MIPKKTGYITRRQQKRTKYRTKRKGAREAAYARDGARCRWPTCRKQLYLESGDVFSLAHAHEINGRAVDDPTDLSKIVTLCARCHGDLHVRVGGKLKRIEGADANGILHFFERLRKRSYHEQAEWHEVGPDSVGEAEAWANS